MQAKVKMVESKLPSNANDFALESFVVLQNTIFLVCRHAGLWNCFAAMASGQQSRPWGRFGSCHSQGCLGLVQFWHLFQTC